MRKAVAGVLGAAILLVHAGAGTAHAAGRGRFIPLLKRRAAVAAPGARPEATRNGPEAAGHGGARPERQRPGAGRPEGNRPGSGAPVAPPGPAPQPPAAAPDPDFHAMIRRLLAAELVRVVLLQQAGVDLAATLGSDFWVQLYLRVVARGLQASLAADPVTGALVLAKGPVQVQILSRNGVTVVSNGQMRLVIPGDLNIGASSSFWRVADAIRAMLDMQALMPPPPPVGI